MVSNKESKLLLLVCIVCTALVFMLPVTSFAMTGSGTTTDPYIIYNSTDLQNIKNNLTACYKLANDIDMTGVSYIPIGRGAVPFSGTLDGSGHTIINLNINSTDAFTGIFGQTSNATIQNLSISAANIASTQNHTGALAGYAYNTTIQNVNITIAKITSTRDYIGALLGYASGSTQVSNVIARYIDSSSIISGNNYVGGLIGRFDGLSITNSSSNIDISGVTHAGGFVGYYSTNALNSSINKCYATGKVTGTSVNSNNIGGFVGYAHSNGTISNSFAHGKVSGNSNVGGFVGSAGGISSTNLLRLTNCYSVGQVSGTTTNSIGGFIGYYGINLTLTSCYYDAVTAKQDVRNALDISQSRFTNNMVKQATYTGWSFSTIWTIAEGSSYPYLSGMEEPSSITATTYVSGSGTADDPYLISTPQQLRNITYELSSNYRLVNDIDLTGVSYVPMGKKNIPFKGTLDGSDYAIKNLKINSTDSYTGIFGYTSNATIQNINITAANITSSQNYTGGLIGYANNTTIQNVNITVVNITSKDCTGALVGYVSGNTQVSNVNVRSVDSSSIISGYNYVGGLIGRFDGLNITNSSSNIDISGVTHAGGFVGNYSTNALNSSINKCYATGKVTGTSSSSYNIGGFVGSTNSDGTISNSFAHGNVSGNSSVGGFIGAGGSTLSTYPLRITNCYSVGQVSATITSDIGGFVGSYSYLTLTSCYYDAVTAKQDVRNGFDVSQSRFTINMVKQANYSGWDFSSVWAIDEGSSYPFLSGMEIPSGVTATTLNTIPGLGTASDPYLISTPQQLRSIIYELNSNYRLVNDIDLTGVSYVPVGNGAVQFRGILDGSGFAIKNLNINSTAVYTGIFGYTANATIQNLNIPAANITSTQKYTGALTGYANTTTIQNVNISAANIKSTQDFTGALTGCAYNTTIQNVNITVVNITSTRDYTGALVGYGSGNTQVSNVNVRSVDSSSIISGYNYVGGLIGQFAGLSITSSSSDIDIFGDTHAGGLVGYYSTNASNSFIKKCYATGKVTGTGANSYYIGGFVGYAYSNGAISNSFAHGNVSGSSSVGGFAGSAGGPAIPLRLTNCYSVGEISGTTTNSIGGFIGGYGNYLTLTNCYYDSSKITGGNSYGTAMTHDASFHQSTYNGFDFTSVWKINEGFSTPYLRDMPIPETIIPPDTTPPTVWIDLPFMGYITRNNTPTVAYSVYDDSDIQSIVTKIGQNGVYTTVYKASGESLGLLSDGEYTFRVEAVDQAGNSAYAEVTFKIDTTPPTVTATPAGGSYTSAQSIVLQSSDPGTIYYTTDGSDPTTSGTRRQYEYQFINVTNNTALKFFAYDQPGNASPVVTEQYVINYDPDSPIVNITSPAAGFISDNTPLLDYTVTDSNPYTVVVKVDGQSVSCVSGEELGLLTDGQHTVRVEAIDSYGNTGYGETTFIVDTVAPVVSITSPQPKHTNDNTPELLYTVSDGIVTVKLDGVVVNKVNGDSLDTLSDGQHIIKVESLDEAGNIGSAQVTFTVDTVAPDVNILSPVSGLTKEKSPLLKYTVSDGTVCVRIDNLVVNTANNEVLNPLTDGHHLLQVEATDLAGNTGSASLSFEVDATPPVVNITSPDSITNDSTPALLYSVSDGIVTLMVDNTIVNKVYGDDIDFLSDGSHTLRIEAVDLVGNIGFEEKVFTVDTVPPTVTCSLEEGTYVSVRQTTLTSSEPAAIYYTVDGSEPTLLSNKYNTSVRLTDSCVLKFMAVDLAGNQSQTYTKEYTIINTAPSTPVISRTPSGNVSIDDFVKITASSTDAEGDAITYIWTGRLAETSKYPQGKVVVTVKAVDEHGLESLPSAIAFWVLDPNGSGGIMLTGPHSRIYENGFEGATIVNYTFNVPPVEGHYSNYDYGQVKGLNIRTRQWEVIQTTPTNNGVSMAKSQTTNPMLPGTYSRLEFYYYTDHDCMYNKSNITYTVEYSFDRSTIGSDIPPESTPTATNVRITGDAKVGKTITGLYQYGDVNGDLEGASVLRWYRSTDEAGAGKQLITGATGTTYTLTNSDASKYIFFEVTPVALTGVDGTLTGTTVLSQPSSRVAALPVAMGVSIQGTPKVSELLTGTYSYFDANGDLEGESVFKWYRADDPAGTNLTVINGATSRTYRLTSLDANKSIFLEVTPLAMTGDDGTLTGIAARSTGTAKVAAYPVALSVVINGAAKEGEVLRGSYTYADPNGDIEGNSVFKWYRANDESGTNRQQISGANSKNYTLVSDDVNKCVSFEVTPVALTGSNGTLTGTPVSSAFTSKVATVPIATNVIVTVTAIVGETVYGNYTYFDSNDDLEGESIFKWYRADDESGTNKQQISGANNKNYTLTADDVNKCILFEVTPVALTGSNGTLTGIPVSSAFTSKVAAVPIAANVIVTGTAIVGETVYGSYTYFDANGDLEGESIFKWYRADDESGNNKTEIPEVIGKSYTISAEDANKYLIFEVTPIALTGIERSLIGETVMSSPTLIQDMLPLPDTGEEPVAKEVIIAGVAKVGEALTGSYKYFDSDGDLEGTSVFKWYRAENPLGTNKIQISDAGGLTYLITEEDRDKYIIFEVTPVAVTGYAGTLMGAPVESRPFMICETVPVASNVVITGTAIVGEAVYGSYNYSDANGDAEGDSMFKWYRADDESGINKTEIPEANGKSYTLTAQDVNKYLILEVIPFALTGTGETLVGEAVYSPPTLVRDIISLPDTGSEPVAEDVIITGVARVGETLTGSYKYFDSDGDLEGASLFKWYRADNPLGTNKSQISDAEGLTYIITQEDQDKYIIFEVTPVAATGNEGTLNGVPVDSKPFMMSEATPIASGVVITGTATVGETLSGSYTYSDANGDMEGDSMFKWYRADDESGANRTEIPEATGDSYTITAQDATKYIIFEVIPIALTGAEDTLAGEAVESTPLSILE